MEISRAAAWLFAACSLLPARTSALLLEDLNIDLNPEKQVRFVPLSNNGPRRSIYTLSMVQVSVPKAQGTESEINDGSLMWSPQKLLLSPGERAGFKLYYSGPKDDRERYYRVTFTETPLAAVPLPSGNAQTRSDFRIAISAIVIVRPARLRFSYRITDSEIINTGNSYFKYMAAQGCSKKYQQAIYLAPGESWSFQPAERGAKKIVVFENQIIPVSHCDETGKNRSMPGGIGLKQ